MERACFVALLWDVLNPFPKPLLISGLCSVKAGTDEGACSWNMLPQHAPGAKLPRLYQRFHAKKLLCILLHWIKLVKYEGASSRSKSVAGACCGSKLPRVYRPLSECESFTPAGWDTALSQVSFQQMLALNRELKYQAFLLSRRPELNCQQMSRTWTRHAVAVLFTEAYKLLFATLLVY